MPNFLRCTVIGHAGGDAETRYLPSGDPVSNFSIAFTEKWKDKQTGERKERTTWFNVNCWGKLGEIAGQYVKKGNALMVEGQPYLEEWQDRNGEKRATLKLRADKIVLLGGRREGAEPPPLPQDGASPAATAAPAEKKPKGHFDDMEDDIPF